MTISKNHTAYYQSVKNYEYIKQQIREAKLKNLSKDKSMNAIEILMPDINQH